MLLPKPDQLLPPFPEQNPSHSGPEIQYIESREPQKEIPLHALDVFDFLIVDPFTEGHEHEQAEHGVLEVVNDFDRSVSLGIRLEAREECVEDPHADSGEGFNAGVVENLGGEVATDGAPRGAVGGGADVALVAGDDFGGGEGFGAVGENGTVLNEGGVGEGAVADEDCRARPDVESDDWTVFGVECSENGFEV